MIIILCNETCGKEVSDSDKVPDSGNGNSKQNASFSFICCEALGRLAWNSYFEEQRWPPTLLWKQNLKTFIE